MKTKRSPGAFTIIELLVVVSIIALLVGILLPAIGKARDQARLSLSLANLRNLATAHQSYAADWADRQYTAVIDNIASYGSSTGIAFDAYGASNGSSGGILDSGNHPPTTLGWGHDHDADVYRVFAYKCNAGQVANASLTQPIIFSSINGVEFFGSFRLPNAKMFNQYVSGRFYDTVWYAPKDELAIKAAQTCFDSPDEYCDHADIDQSLGDTPVWSSYCSSPAAMYNPDVMRHIDPDDPSANGWVNPFSLPSGFRSPAFSQALYPSLKTHMLEHNLLQNPVAECNPGFSPGSFDGCEPYYFNHSWESTPACLFYDGHVDMIGVRETMRADGRMRAQTGVPEWGLWSHDTPWDYDGYLSAYAFDQATTSFHILTTDGIRGRDIMDN